MLAPRKLPLAVVAATAEPPAPPAAEEFRVDALNAAVDANVGKVVVLKGVYGSFTKVETPPSLNVVLHQDDTLAADHKVVCVMDVAKEAEVTALVAKARIDVTGTVSKDAAGMTTLTGCAVAPPGAESQAAVGSEMLTTQDIAVLLSVQAAVRSETNWKRTGALRRTASARAMLMPAMLVSAAFLMRWLPRNTVKVGIASIISVAKIAMPIISSMRLKPRCCLAGRISKSRPSS